MTDKPSYKTAHEVEKLPEMKVPGNINLNGRPVIANKDGSYSSEKSFSRGTDDGEVLVPKIVNGKELSEDDAWKHYQKSGEHLGIFDSPAHADSYAEKTHNRTLTDSNGKVNQEAEAAIHPPYDSKIPDELK